MIDTERREAARQFINRWRGKGKEDEDGRSYWIELLSNIFGVENVTERIDFEKKVVVDGHTKRIDVYIPETKVIIEQKSLNVPLDKKVRNSGEVDLTAFEQADRYNSKLIFDERARWIVTCNFAEIWIYDMNERQPKPSKIMLEELQTKYSLLDFLIKKEVQKISHEMEVSIKAGEIVGLIYNAFLEQYKIPKVKKNETEVEKEKREHKLKSLNALCVRLVFCLYAEDAGIFGGKRNMFHDYLARYEARDCRRALIELFKVLDTKEEEREDYLEEDLAQFPYVNGGLFADETIEIPQFTEKIRELLLTKASEKFNWRDISPTIFGAVFESTLNPETRRSGGMHYTSIENIHKVIDPLFLDELQEEFETIQAYKTLDIKRKRLMDFQEKLAHLKFLDPACGSGNFLTETYLSLRRLENKVLQVLFGEGQGVLGIAASDIIKVSIQQFYGIEINDFAVTVAKTALWIAESQMLEETKNIIYGLDGDFLPLKTYVNITEDNAFTKASRDESGFALRVMELFFEQKNFNVSIILNALDELIAYNSANVAKVEQAYKLRAKCLSKLKRKKEERQNNISLADYYLDFAEKTFQKDIQGAWRAVNFYQKGIILYRNNGKPEKASAAQKRLIEIQKEIPKTMMPISIKLDIKGVVDNIKANIEGLSFEECVVRLIQMFGFEKQEDIKNRVIKEFKDQPIPHLFGKNLINAQGQTVLTLPPLDIHNPEKDSRLIELHMYQNELEKQKFIGDVWIKNALNIIRDRFVIDKPMVEFLVKDNPIIPTGRERIFQSGVYMFFNGDYYEAIHILAPQVENLFRAIAQGAGGITVTLEKDGTSMEKVLSSILSLPELMDCYDNDILFIFRGLLNERAGANIRNEIAHGIISESACSTGACLYFGMAVIKLLSLTSSPYYQILKNSEKLKHFEIPSKDTLKIIR